MLIALHHSVQSEKKDYIDARKNPKLIHFCGHIKPWHKETNHPYAVEYEQYVSKIGENSLSAQLTGFFYPPAS
ncbi:glycosyltransferase [Amylolactobacillus amylophilus]|uniref:glycosyltransferase n=1 Tax=Amylolactobacillus amylophilus TaxID=1603 RepID=UPI0034E27922